jgi:hypothetical protein
VTGRAGTGKTSVLGYAFDEEIRTTGKDRVILCAPTGRAAKRIQELTGIKAMTIHKLLEFPQPDDEDKDGNPLPPLPRRNRSRPLYQKIVYVDESSMISQELYEQIMEAPPPNGSIRFFGDNYQLLRWIREHLRGVCFEPRLRKNFSIAGGAWTKSLPTRKGSRMAVFLSVTTGSRSYILAHRLPRLSKCLMKVLRKQRLRLSCQLEMVSMEPIGSTQQSKYALIRREIFFGLIVSRSYSKPTNPNLN